MHGTGAYPSNYIRCAMCEANIAGGVDLFSWPVLDSF